LRAPAGEPLHLLGRPDVAVDLARALVDVDRRRAGASERIEHLAAMSFTEMSTPVATFSTSPAMRSIGVSMIVSIASASSST